MNSQILKKRIKQIRGLLSLKNIDSVIVTIPANVTYTTGFSGDDSWAVVTTKAVYLVTDSRYTEQALAECQNCKIIERTAPIAQTAATLIKKLKSVETIAVEDTTSFAEYKNIKKNIKSRLKTTSRLIESVRTCKDKSEIAAIKKAAQIAKQALANSRRYIKPGITENQLAGILNLQIRKLDAKNSFETIVAFGPNASRVHHQPTNRKLKTNDAILIDWGVKYKGYCCDLTRCFTIGKASNFYKKVHNAVKQAQLAAIKMIKDGIDIQKVDSAARKVIAENNLPVYGHGTGHGIGLEYHESPTLAKKIKGKLQAGQVITIEPGVYIPGKLGVRIEDDILVTKTGFKILTR